MTQQTEKNKSEKLVEVRCWNCGKLLGELPENAPYKIKCFRCKEMNVKEKQNG
jgi:phage FluMu protein Com